MPFALYVTLAVAEILYRNFRVKAAMMQNWYCTSLYSCTLKQWTCV